MNSSHTHQVRLWYHLGVLFKISDDHPRLFYMGAPSPPAGFPAVFAPLGELILSVRAFGQSRQTDNYVLKCFILCSCVCFDLINCNDAQSLFRFDTSS